MSSEAPRPWWATPEDVRGLDGQDPLTAHRAARRGSGDAPRDVGSDEVPGHDPDVCGICPWCAGLRMLSVSHPEVVGHLTDAARHLTQAVRALVADLQGAGPDDAADGDGAPFERIDLD